MEVVRECSGELQDNYYLLYLSQEHSISHEFDYCVI